jgi:hypothetical protein
MHPEEMLDGIDEHFHADVEDLRIEPISVAEAAELFGSVPNDDEIAEAREYIQSSFD